MADVERFEVDPEAAEAFLADQKNEETPDDDAEEKTTEQADDSEVTEDGDSEDAEQESNELGIPDKDEKSEKDDADPDAGDKDDDDTSKGDKPAAVDLDYTSLSEEFVRNGGELSEKSLNDVYAKVEKAGFPRELVDDFILGQRVRLASSVQAGHDLVGGKESYEGMIAWAKDNLSPEDKEAFNVDARSGDERRARLAIQDLHSKYLEAHGGTEPNLSPRAGSPTSGDLSAIENRAQLLELQKSDRYRKDAAYRKQVAERLRRSMESGRYKQ